MAFSRFQEVHELVDSVWLGDLCSRLARPVHARSELLVTGQQRSHVERLVTVFVRQFQHVGVLENAAGNVRFAYFCRLHDFVLRLNRTDQSARSFSR